MSILFTHPDHGPEKNILCQGYRDSATGLSRWEQEQMENRIAEKVLARLSISVDVQKAIQEIEALWKAINNLTKGH